MSRIPDFTKVALETTSVDGCAAQDWLTPEGLHQYGGGYTEYVERTGHEAPGLHS